MGVGAGGGGQFCQLTIFHETPSKKLPSPPLPQLCRETARMSLSTSVRHTEELGENEYLPSTCRREMYRDVHI